MGKVLEGWQIPDGAGQSTVVVERVEHPDAALTQVVIDIDLQTFTDVTFSEQTAHAFVRHGVLFLMRAEGRVIGTCVCMRSWSAPREAALVAMGILPGWRGRGLGQRFIRSVMRQLAHEGVEALSLQVGAINERAMKVYEDVGFAVQDEVLRQPGRPESGTLLELRAELGHLAAVAALA